jgi:hypothetical protein
MTRSYSTVIWANKEIAKLNKEMYLLGYTSLVRSNGSILGEGENWRSKAGSWVKKTLSAAPFSDAYCLGCCTRHLVRRKTKSTSQNCCEDKNNQPSKLNHT